MTPDTGTQFLTSSAVRAQKSFNRVRHALEQLTDEDIWWRPHEEMNSIGNLILHLCGNLRQWIVSGVGGAKDIRKRSAEFESRENIPKKELLRRFDQVIAEVKTTFAAADPAKLLTRKRIQGFDEVLLDAIYSTMTHLDGHAMQIVYIARLRLGDKYKVLWNPANAEQKSD